MAFISFRRSWGAIGNFNEGNVMIATKYQKDCFGGIMGMGQEEVGPGMMTD